MLRSSPSALVASLLALVLAFTGCKSMYRDMYSPKRARFVPPPPPKPQELPAERMPPPVEATPTMPPADQPPPAELPPPVAPPPGAMLPG
ncbi:MAG: hypothetical protein M3463_22730 [Verrucomicrobiota bacterium]|nr:hypothetical protein [Verrucomicrobiota bacterium]